MASLPKMPPVHLALLAGQCAQPQVCLRARHRAYRHVPPQQRPPSRETHAPAASRAIEWSAGAGGGPGSPERSRCKRSSREFGDAARARGDIDRATDSIVMNAELRDRPHLPVLGIEEPADAPLSLAEAGFSPHAATRAGAADQRARLALVKYVLRPPIANDRLELRPGDW